MKFLDLFEQWKRDQRPENDPKYCSDNAAFALIKFLTSHDPSFIKEGYGFAYELQFKETDHLCIAFDPISFDPYKVNVFEHSDTRSPNMLSFTQDRYTVIEEETQRGVIGLLEQYAEELYDDGTW